jgi:hypothetical protein
MNTIGKCLRLDIVKLALGFNMSFFFFLGDLPRMAYGTVVHSFMSAAVVNEKTATTTEWKPRITF